MRKSLSSAVLAEVTYLLWMIWRLADLLYLPKNWYHAANDRPLPYQLCDKSIAIEVMQKCQSFPFINTPFGCQPISAHHSPIFVDYCTYTYIKK